MRSDMTVDASGQVLVRGGVLRVVGQQGKRSSVRIGLSPVTVGRGAECDLVIEDPKVSTIHLELVGSNEGVVLEDHRSRNGTFVGGARVSRALLVDGTRIRIGDTVLAFSPARSAPLAYDHATRFGDVVGASTSMRLVFDRLARGAPTELTALITGETGCGKELVAAAIHGASDRRAGPFVVVDCGAIPAGLAESTLFGHERGAFTGATDARRSPFVEASGGTIFLDEIGELPLELQPKLLRVLAERRVKAVGANAYVDVDVRVVAATRRDVVAEVNEGAFRSDLYFRLAELRVEVPPLRARPEDIPLLLELFFTELGHPDAMSRLSTTELETLLRHGWPGNVRELRSVAATAVAMADPAGPLEPSVYLDPARFELGAELEGLPYHEARTAALGRFEARYFAGLLRETGGNLAEIARRAGLARTHVRKYVLRHNLAAPRPAFGGRKAGTSE